MERRPCPIAPLTPDDGEHYFFGYFDKTPWSADGETLLAHRTRFLDRAPDASDEVEVGLLSAVGREPTFRKLGTTTAWNWQQGAQLQWLPRAAEPSAEQAVLFNTRAADGSLGARVTRRNGVKQRQLSQPVFTVSADGVSALALNYGRLTALRPEYGVAGVEDPCRGEAAPETDGIFHVDPATGVSRLLISTADVVAHQRVEAGGGAMHYLNHAAFNPSGMRFCFFHRFERRDKITQTRLFTLNTDGTDLRLLFDGMVSHLDWRDDQTILAWAGRRKLLQEGGGGGAFNGVKGAVRRSLKPIYYALGKPRFLMNRIVKDSYLLIFDEEGGPTRPFAAGQLSCDGHCTWSADRRWVVTDGYPDLRNRQPLYLWDVVGSIGYEIGRYPTPRELDGPTRVDLHPRFNRDASAVCIDSAMDGTRRMYRIDVSSITQNAS